jgi:rhamnosyltransferase subunit B
LLAHDRDLILDGDVARMERVKFGEPFAHDQFDNAARITRLGVGRILPRAKYNTMRAIKELSRLLKEQSYTIRATAIARHVQIEDGIRTACDAIGEQLLHHP